MNHTVTFRTRVESILKNKSNSNIDPGPSRATILVATIDAEIRNGLKELFDAFSFNTVWLNGVEAAKSVLAREKISACLCGFWLQDGTYRELVRHIRRQRIEIPVIIVSAPACPNEYRDYLSAMNIGALDFLCHPYRKSELEKMLWFVAEDRARPIHPQQINPQTSINANPVLQAGEAGLTTA